MGSVQGLGSFQSRTVTTSISFGALKTGSYGTWRAAQRQKVPVSMSGSEPLPPLPNTLAHLQGFMDPDMDHTH